MAKLADDETGARVNAFVTDTAGGFAASMLEGMVWSIHAAVAAAQSAARQVAYEEKATERYASAFAFLRDPHAAPETVRHVVEHFKGLWQVAASGSFENSGAQAQASSVQPPRSAETFVLLAGLSMARAVRLVMQLIPGGATCLVPDPIQIGLVNVGGDFMESLGEAWRFVTAQGGCPPGCQLRWWLEGHQGLVQAAGESGGAAAAMAAMAAIAGVPLVE